MGANVMKGELSIKQWKNDAGSQDPERVSDSGRWLVGLDTRLECILM
jgi:hypothetical protein